MRRAACVILLASLAFASLDLLSVAPRLTSLGSHAAAQTIDVGSGVRVAAAPGRKVNVRAEPVVSDGNIVAGATGGNLLRVVGQEMRDAFTWYHVETLSEAPAAYQGWIRGDLLVPAQLPESEIVAAPVVAAEPVAPVAAPAPAEQPARAPAAPLPLNQRTDWSRDLIKLYPAIMGCVALNSAPPVTVLRSTQRSRGLAEVAMANSAGRRWDCIISASGGTPVRYDPLSGGASRYGHIGREPLFQPGGERPQLDKACYSVEAVEDPESGAQLGWLYYRTCP